MKYLRNQTIARQRLTLLNTNRNQFMTNSFNKKFCFNGRQNLDKFFDSIRDKLYEKLLIFSSILRIQSNIYMALRMRRMAQIYGLYNRIYSEKSVNKLMSQLLIRMRSKALFLRLITNRDNNKSNNCVKCVLSAVCGVFCWEKERITDKELNQSIEEFVSIQTISINSRFNKNNSSINSSFSVSVETNIINNDNNNCNDSKDCDEYKSDSDNFLDTEWEAVIMRQDLKVWRRRAKNTSLYEYKIFGTFDDIPARTFFNVQMDTDFRKVWDKLVIKLDIIEKETFVSDRDLNNGEDSGNEVLHWVMRYPYPMNTRDYVYLRRSRIDVNKNLMVLVSKSIKHPKLPETSDHVRVFDYSSQMVIKPHKTFDDCGFDYMLTYFDDPRAAFPSPAYNWMASCGVPDFVEKLHLAAIQLYFSNNYKPNKYSKQCYNNSTNNKNATHSAECIYA